MATKITVDLANKILIINAGVVYLDAKIDIYSDLKEDWILDANNESKFEFPVRTAGGDLLPGGLVAGSYFFLRNDLGWRIRPQEANHELQLYGNLYAEDTDSPIFTETLGDYTVSIQLERSSLTQVAMTGGSALTAEEHNELFKIRGNENDDLEILSEQIDTVQETLNNLEIPPPDPDPDIASIRDKLLEIFLLYGLDPSKPLVVTPASRVCGSIRQSIATGVGNSVIVQRL